MKRVVAGAVLMSMLGGSVAGAQDLAAIERAEAQLVAAWEASPILFRTAAFVSEPPGGYGIYKERPSPSFAPGEPIMVYAEPVGYGWSENADGTFTFGFAIDLLIKKPDGTVVGGQENFQKVELTSRARNREFMLTLTLNLDGAPAGDYVLEYRTRDIASEKAGVISMPFRIAG